MANKSLFQSHSLKTPVANTVNEAGSAAYALSPKEQLAQYVATGCFNGVFYASGETQLDTIKSLCDSVDNGFVAKLALYARKKAHMKDTPAFLVAYLAAKDTKLFKKVFPQVIDNGKMLRNFVQIMRSGVVGRKSLGSAPKKAIIEWLNSRSDERIFFDSVGNDPSMVDIIKMVHPRPQTKKREALYGYLLGKKYSKKNIDKSVREFEKFKSTLEGDAPAVPFQMLTGLPLTEKHWKKIAEDAKWTMTRMNLNTFNRHNVFSNKKLVSKIAKRLANPNEIKKAKAFPYQLLMAYVSASNFELPHSYWGSYLVGTTKTQELPTEIVDALHDATEISLDNVPKINGKVYVLIDVSGSMHSPITGQRGSATTSVSCLLAAALFASAIKKKNPDAVIIPFSDDVVRFSGLSHRDSVLTNAKTLAALPSGGTNCSAPLKKLNYDQAKGDVIIYLSDNQSWMDHRLNYYSTATAGEWKKFKKRNPNAKMVCVDMQPYGTAQAPNDRSILNIGGFSDVLFDVIADFVEHGNDSSFWVKQIEQVDL